MEEIDSQVAEAPASAEFFEDAYDFPTRLARTGKIVVTGAAEGAYEYGKHKAAEVSNLLRTRAAGMSALEHHMSRDR
jgi:hypothetical protein